VQALARSGQNLKDGFRFGDAGGAASGQLDTQGQR